MRRSPRPRRTWRAPCARGPRGRRAGPGGGLGDRRRQRVVLGGRVLVDGDDRLGCADRPRGQPDAVEDQPRPAADQVPVLDRARLPLGRVGQDDGPRRRRRPAAIWRRLGMPRRPGRGSRPVRRGRSGRSASCVGPAPRSRQSATDLGLVEQQPRRRGAPPLARLALARPAPPRAHPTPAAARGPRGWRCGGTARPPPALGPARPGRCRRSPASRGSRRPARNGRGRTAPVRPARRPPGHRIG